MHPTLTPRLETVAKLVPAGARLVDVGTDHAYLPAYLLAAGKVSAAIATDIRPGPLGRGRETAERYGLEEQLSLRLCDGLAGVEPNEVDAVVVAGMGGETILGILEAAAWSLEKVCILQPMSAAEALRGGLARLGVPILREVLVKEGSTLYLTLLLDGIPAQRPQPPTAAEIYVGTLQAHRGDPLWPEYFAASRRRAQRALAGLERSKRPEDAARRAFFADVLQGLEQMEKEMEYT